MVEKIKSLSRRLFARIKALYTMTDEEKAFFNEW
jgi:hypothetical protein